MSHDNYDALDHALFALPLEEPPTDLRTSILAATAYRPAPVFSMRDIVVIGLILATMVWLVAAIVAGGVGLFAHTVAMIGGTFERFLSDVRTIGWLGAGAATALWLSLFTGFQPLAARARKVEAPPQR